MLFLRGGIIREMDGWMAREQMNKQMDRQMNDGL